MLVSTLFPPRLVARNDEKHVPPPQWPAALPSPPPGRWLPAPRTQRMLHSCLMTELPARSICSPRGKGRWLGSTAVIVRARGHHRGAARAQSSSPRSSRKAAESFGPLRRTQSWLSPYSGQHGWEKVLSTTGRWVLDPGLCSVGQGWVVLEGHGKPGARGLQGSWGWWVIPILFPGAVGTEGALGAHGHEGSAPKAATAP